MGDAMKARDLRVGDEIGFWTVVSVFEACGVVETVADSPGMTYANGEPLEGRIVSRNADPWNTLVMVELRDGQSQTLTRAWYRADEEVTP